MKKLLTISLLLLTVSITYCQNNGFLPIMRSNAEWYGAKYYGWSNDVDNIRFVIDTTQVTIDNKSYHRILATDQKSDLVTKPSGVYIREAEGKIWLWDYPKLAKENLALDMNLSVGDTLREDLVQTFTRYLLTVKSVDTVKYNDNKPRKRLMLGCSSDPDGIYAVWVEGIGSSKGMFEQESVCIIDGPVYNLRCYFENGIQLLNSDDGKSCWYTTATNDPSINTLTTFPNPSSTFTNIKLSDDMILPVQYEVVSVAGQSVEIGNHNRSQDLQINTNDIQSGLSIVLVSDKVGKVWRGKVLVE